MQERQSCRGSVYLAVLCGCLFLTVLGQLALLYAGHSYEKALSFYRTYQLRLLAESALTACDSLSDALGDSGELELARVVLQPGSRQAIVTLRQNVSSDDCFRQLAAQAELADADSISASEVGSQLLQRLELTLPPSVQELAAAYGLVCSGSLSGAEYLSEGALYASGREVCLPQTDFLAGRAVSTLSADEVADIGLVRHFYYLTDGGTYTFAAGQRVWGSAVVAVAANTVLSLGEGCSFRDRVIFICCGPMKIGANVTLAQALIIAGGKVTIGSGCQINGVILSGGNIEIKGPLALTQDETVVAPFSSVNFIAGGGL